MWNISFTIRRDPMQWWPDSEEQKTLKDSDKVFGVCCWARHNIAMIYLPIYTSSLMVFRLCRSYKDPPLKKYSFHMELSVSSVAQTSHSSYLCQSIFAIDDGVLSFLRFYVRRAQISKLEKDYSMHSEYFRVFWIFRVSLKVLHIQEEPFGHLTVFQSLQLS